MFKQSYLKSIIEDFDLYIVEHCEIQSSFYEDDTWLIINFDKKAKYKKLEIRIYDYRHIQPGTNAFLADKFCGNICIMLDFVGNNSGSCWFEVFTDVESIVKNLINNEYLQKKKLKVIQLDIFDYLEGRIK